MGNIGNFFRKKIFKFGIFEARDLRGLEYNRWWFPESVWLLPPWSTDTPFITRLETWKIKLMTRSDQIISMFLLVLKELFSDLGADGMRTLVPGSSSAVPISIKSSFWMISANLQLLSEDVQRFLLLRVILIWGYWSWIIGWQSEKLLLSEKLPCNNIKILWFYHL